MEKAKYVIGGSIAYLIGSLFSAILVVWKETNESVYNWLKDTFGHHWIGHGILTLLIFFIVFAISSAAYKVDSMENKHNLVNALVVIATILSFIIILGFFLIE